jgi:phage RecT family recombinase
MYQNQGNNNVQLWQQKGVIAATCKKMSVRMLFEEGKQGDEKFKKFQYVLGSMVMSPKSDFLRKQTSPDSVIQVAAEAARHDLMVDGKESAVVTFNNQAALVIMPVGLLKIAYRNPEILRIHSDVVRENDKFSYNPVEGELVHVIDWMQSDDQRGDIILAYAFADVERGSRQMRMVQIANKSAIDKAKAASSSANGKGAKYSPWANYYDEMAKKTALRKLCKILPVHVATEDDTGHAEWQVEERAQPAEQPAPHQFIDAEAEPVQQHQHQQPQQQYQEPVQQQRYEPAQPVQQQSQQQPPPIDAEWAQFEPADMAAAL